MRIFKKEDSIGRTFLTEPFHTGEQFQARIIEAIENHNKKTQNNPEHQKFLCSVNNDQYQDIFSYNEILKYIEEQNNDDGFWKFKRIIDHKGPLTKNDPDYANSTYNVLLEWETGEVSWEPHNRVSAEDLVPCDIYAKDNNLLNMDGGKRFKKRAKNQKQLLRLTDQAKLISFCTSPKYMYGFKIPRDYDHARELDTQNGNNKWKTSTQEELQLLQDYNTFLNIGNDKISGGDYKKIRLHLIYAVKHNSRHCARLVANGNMTQVPIASVNSSVVSLKGLRIIVFVLELNDLKLWNTDTCSAFVEAYCSELV